MLDFNDAPRLDRPQLAVDNSERIERLRGVLQDRAADLVRDLFPLARLGRSEARVGSLAGEVGESLSIQLTGPDAGQWLDHANPDSDKGDLIELWMRLEHRPFMDAVDDLERWAGIHTAPAFTSRVRGFSAARVERDKDKPRPSAELPAPSARWHYKAVDGTILGVVTRYDLDEVSDKTGKRKKTFRAMNGRGEPKMPDPRPLYRLPQIAGASVVVLVEGEKCADALETIGIEATTAMGGCGTDPAKTDWTPLAGKLVVIWPDADPSGSKLPEKLKPILEAIGCEVRVVRVPDGRPLGWDAADAIAEEDDVEAVLATSKPPPLVEAATQARRLRILSEEDLDELPEPEWLVDGILPEKSLAMVYGPPGSAKSFVAVDIAMSVAAGLDWHGREVGAGYALYVAGEGGAAISKRFRGWRMSRGIAPTGRLGIVASAVAMPTGELDELLTLIGELLELPRLIVLDTVARTFGAGNENDQKDMNAYVAACDKLRIATGAAVLVIHHSGKDVEKGARGSSVLPGAVDVSIAVTRKDDVVTIRNRAPYGKMKDAEEFEDILLQSHTVEMGTTDKGKAITTLVLSQYDGEPVTDDRPTDEHWDDARRTAHQQKARLSDLQRRIISELRARKAADAPGLGLLSLTHLTQSGQGAVYNSLKALAQGNSQRPALIEKTKSESGAELWVARGRPEDWEGFTPLPAPDDEEGGE